MGPIVRSGDVTGSDQGLERLRRDLRPTLLALDRVAADPDLPADLADELPTLQYALHIATEKGLVPLLGTQPDGVFDELDYALSVVREETAEVAERLMEAGPAAAAPLLWEWRAALFGVRLALLRLEQVEVGEESPPLPRARFLPVLLLAAGVTWVLGGALADLWPVWVGGLALVAASTGLSRRP